MQGCVPISRLAGRDILLAGLLCAAVFSYAHWHGLTNPYVSNDDVRQQVFWMQRYSDPQLYPSDPLADYARLYVPSGVKALYWLASPVCGAVEFSKVLTGGLFVLLGICLWGIGASLGGRGLGWTTLGVFWLMPAFLYNMSGGISRSFASPLLALYFLCWLRGNAKWMGLTLLLQAICIPYICILCTAACLLAAAAGRLRPALAPPFPAKFWHLGLVILAAALIWAMSRGFDAAGYGPLVSKADMIGRPEFTAQGRLELYPQPGLFMDAVYYPFERIGFFLEGGLGLGIATLALILGLAFYFGRKACWRVILARSRPLICLLAVSLGLYVLARMVLLKLFVPDRYVSYTLYMIYCLGLAVCFHAGLRRIAANRWLAAAAILIAAVAGGLRLHGQGLFDYSRDAGLYAAVRQTPKDSLIAGNPNLMDNVLTFGQRKVFVAYKLAHPWSKGWWGFVEPRLEGFFKAYYAGDPDEVRDFCRENKIDFLVVDPGDFTPACLANHPFFAPFGAYIKNLTQGRTSFVLLSAKDFPYVDVGRGLRLIDMRQ